MRLNLKMFVQSLALLTIILFVAGCAKDENVTPQNLPLNERGGSTIIGTPNTLVYGLSDQNEIVRLMTGPPAKEMSRMPISGLRDTDEIVISIDIRPATRQLYGVSNLSLLYVIDPTSGVAKPVSADPFFPALVGTNVGFDFDPRADQIRLTDEKHQNLRIDPNTGQVTNVDLPLNPPNLSINGVAYSATGFGFFASRLFDIDISQGYLYVQDPVSGFLSPIGSLGLTISGEGGFDISRDNMALAILYGSGRGGGGGGSIDADPAFRLYSISLKSGIANSFGKVKPLIGIAIP